MYGTSLENVHNDNLTNDVNIINNLKIPYCNKALHIIICYVTGRLMFFVCLFWINI